MMGKIYCTSFDSRIGKIYVASTGKGVCKISIPASTKKDFLEWIEAHSNGYEIVEANSSNKQIIDELSHYFERTLVKFQSRLHLIGTEFQVRVWSALRKIPYGTTITYKGLAKAVGKPHAFQAVGRANAANPLPIVIPCHRVVGTDASLVGYGAGIKTKEFLLRLEGAIMV